MSSSLKKTFISAIALLAIGFAIYGVYTWQKDRAGEPIRQGEEIR